MKADMRRPARMGLRARISERLRIKVRLWIDGHQVTHFGDPGHRLEWEYPSYPRSRILQVSPDDGDPVRVGKYTGIHYSAILVPGGKHNFDWVGSLHAHVEDGEWVNPPDPIRSDGPIIIGNDVFIGFEAFISSGVTIGDGAVVAARAMVTKSVEPYSMVGGNPAKHIKYRFDEPTREALQRISWWDWPVDKVAQHKNQIHSPDVAGFVAGHDPALGLVSCEVCRG